MRAAGEPWAQPVGTAAPQLHSAALWESESGAARAYIFQETPEIWMFFVPCLFINIGD